MIEESTRRILFEPEHHAFRESARAFIGKEITPYCPEWERAGIAPRELFVAAGSLGLFAAVPEQYGGAGISDFRFSTVFAEEAARAGVSPVALGFAPQPDVCMPYFLNLADEAQKRRWLPGIADGGLITAIARTEPNAGSDLTGIRTSAVRDGEHRHKGLSLLVVERGMAGFERGRNLDKVGMHAQDTAELTFTDVRVPAENLLGVEGEGFYGLTGNLPRERLSRATLGLAQAAAALETTIAYVRDRKAFGKPIGALQHTRFLLAELVTEVELARQFLDRCAFELNAGALDAVDAATAKWWATELQGRVIDACVQLHGGYGYMFEYPIARAWIDSRISRIYGGSTEIMKEIIGRSLELA